MWRIKCNINTKAIDSKRKRTEGSDPITSRENKSGLNPNLPFVKPGKDLDADEETVSIKMCIDDTMSKEDKKNYETNSFKVI